ncbi:hypothetical protein C882_3005 [Caenispirillum salinarum AK4]|uniref:Uncharacterized protein n=1 Tax=Caenispirillum salinarum AK4 TaxID=1238182 RepID=K9HUK6_9PROT|nr:hypothetical protein [Caenispirillum salinarum]EKV31941.1 hypothetical protein C882_3005 [Caenispirillum salinarum AK4]
MDDRQPTSLGNLSRLLQRPDFVALTLAEVMVAMVFLVIIIGAASGAFATNEPSREALMEERERLMALENALGKGLGKSEVVPADVDALFSRLVALSELETQVARLKEELSEERAQKEEMASSLTDDKRELLAKYSDVKHQLEAERQAREAAERRLKATEDFAKALAARLQEAQQQADDLEAEMADKRQQNQVLRSRVAKLEEVTGGGAGIGAPACWRKGDDPDGALQYLANVKAFNGYLIVSPAWPASRADQAAALGLDRQMLGGVMSRSDFRRVFRRIYDDSERRGCRYYVRYDNNAVTDANQLRAMDELVEGHVYIYRTRLR